MLSGKRQVTRNSILACWRSHRTTLVVALGAAAILIGNAATAEEAGDYKIGVLSDLSGPIASISRPATAGLKAYINAVNAAGGVNGRRISLEIRDTKSDAQATRTQFVALAGSGVSAVIGPDLSTNYQLISGPAAEAKVPLLSHGAPDGLVSSGQPYYYLTGLLLQYAAKIAVNDIQAKLKAAGSSKPPKIAALHTNSPSTIGWRDGLISYVKDAFGNELSAVEQLDAKEINVTSPVSKIVATQPDFVLLRILGTQVPLVVKALREKGFTGEVIADVNGSDTAVLKSVNDPKYSVIRAFADPTDAGDSSVQKLLADAKLAGVEQDATSAFFTYGYVSGSLVFQALKSCPSPCDGVAFDKAMSTLKPVAIEGLSGPLGYQNGDHRLVHFGRIYVWDSAKGAAVPQTDWINSGN
jgi:branched-chain amino acid transport system substrate-binding protein